MSSNQNVHLVIRNTRPDDIEKIAKLQQESFPTLARYNNIWHPEELKSHLQIFPQGQVVAVEEDGTVVGSASTLIINLDPEYAKHTWKGITVDCMFTNHNPAARKELVMRLGLRRMISGGRLFNYCECADRMSAGIWQGCH